MFRKVIDFLNAEVRFTMDSLSGARELSCCISSVLLNKKYNEVNVVELKKTHGKEILGKLYYCAFSLVLFLLFVPYKLELKICCLIFLCFIVVSLTKL